MWSPLRTASIPRWPWCVWVHRICPDRRNRVPWTFVLGAALWMNISIWRLLRMTLHWSSWAVRRPLAVSGGTTMIDFTLYPLVCWFVFQLVWWWLLVVGLSLCLFLALLISFNYLPYFLLFLISNVKSFCIFLSLNWPLSSRFLCHLYLIAIYIRLCLSLYLFCYITLFRLSHGHLSHLFLFCLSKLPLLVLISTLCLSSVPHLIFILSLFLFQLVLISFSSFSRLFLICPSSPSHLFFIFISSSSLPHLSFISRFSLPDLFLISFSSLSHHFLMISSLLPLLFFITSFSLPHYFLFSSSFFFLPHLLPITSLTLPHLFLSHCLSLFLRPNSPHLPSGFRSLSTWGWVRGHESLRGWLRRHQAPRCHLKRAARGTGAHCITSELRAELQIRLPVCTI